LISLWPHGSWPARYPLPVPPLWPPIAPSPRPLFPLRSAVSSRQSSDAFFQSTRWTIRSCLAPWRSDAEAPFDHVAEREARARADGGDDQRLNTEGARDDRRAAHHRRHHMPADDAAERADDDGRNGAALL